MNLWNELKHGPRHSGRASFGVRRKPHGLHCLHAPRHSGRASFGVRRKPHGLHCLRCKVFRVAVVYAATAFVVLQAADIMLPRMGIPEWGVGLVVALAVLGFPIALVLAWALELTPDGVKVQRTETMNAVPEETPALLHAAR